VLPVFSSSVVTIIHCGVERATVGVFIRKSHRIRCRFHAASVFPNGPSDEGGWIDKACAAVRSMRPETSKAAGAVLVLPPQVTLLKHLRIPRMDSRKRARIVAFEAGQSIPCALSDVAWDSASCGQDQTTEGILLAAVKLEIIEPLCAAAAAAGFALRVVVPSSLSILVAHRAVRSARPESEMLFHLQSNAATVLQRCGRDFALRTFTLGSDAEGVGTEALTARLEQEVARSMVHFQRQCGIANPVRVHVSRSGPAGSEIECALAQRLRVPVEGIELTGVADFEPSARMSIPAGVLAEMGGAALMQLDPAHTRMNLLPRGLSTQQRRRGRRPWLVATAALVLVMPMMPLIHYQLVAQSAYRKRAEIETGLAPLRDREARIRVQLTQLENLKSQLAAWQGVRHRRVGWLQLLADLEQRLNRVEDVWFDKLSVMPVPGEGPLKLAVSGRVLDRDHLNMGSVTTFQRVKTVATSLMESPFVQAIEDERFDRNQPGVLVFDWVLVMDATKPL
jgi:type IV pilus assembly protein PilM